MPNSISVSFSDVGHRSRPRRCARTAEEKAAIVANTVSAVWSLISAGKVGPVVHAEFSLERVDETHRVLEESSHVGKLVLVTGA